MIDDDLLELVAECYVALRAGGHLRDFPTFESFLRRAMVPSRQRGPTPLRSELSDLAEAPRPDPTSAN